MARAQALASGRTSAGSDARQLSVPISRCTRGSCPRAPEPRVARDRFEQRVAWHLRYPRLAARRYTEGVVCLATGRSDPAPNVADGRRLDGGRPCWGDQSPGGLGRPPAGRPPAMAARPLAAFSGSRPECPTLQRAMARTKEWPRTEIAVDAGAGRQPVGRETAPEGSRALPGCGVGVRVTRRLLRGTFPRDGLRVPNSVQANGRKPYARACAS